ncbi:NUDIX domain-containing protein [[Mycoplasma] gypis]|uniref:NUDIX domain-containing protein n=1 Tax=[Mycoplasma] gypis TaxID=92404 RepID=A0ABZ2RUD6_9BACT|nr:NUDIX domain-containing protein [[Mycoplasma] gypis]MBN0919520.1 NUDIX domain-containing protein [[Mycoplasma] gypis]
MIWEQLNNDKQETSAGVIGFYEYSFLGIKKYKVLLTQNSKSLKWGFPKGHIEYRELCYQTAKREVFEETGQMVEKILPFTFESNYVLDGGVNKKVIYFLATFSKKQKVNISDPLISQAKFVSMDKVMNYLSFKQDKNNFKNTLDLLQKDKDLFKKEYKMKDLLQPWELNIE